MPEPVEITTPPRELPEITLPRAAVVPPMVLFDELVVIEMPVALGRPAVPAAFKPIVLPVMILPLLVVTICTPAMVFPEMRLPSAAESTSETFVPTRTPLVETDKLIPNWLGMADVPAGLVPM